MPRGGKKWTPAYRKKRAKSSRDRERKAQKRAKNELNYAIALIQFKVDRATVMHGAPLGMKEVDKSKDKDWILKGIEDHKTRIGKLNRWQTYYLKHNDEPLFEVRDYVANFEDGMTVAFEAGWKTLFTKKDAQSFINRHNANLVKLRGKLLYNYVNRWRNAGELRATTNFGLICPSNWLNWIEREYEKLFEWERQNKPKNPLGSGLGTYVDPGSVF